jgi:CheY-like chemotaxis protein
LGDEIRLRAQLAPVDVNVRADPALIEQVILNLAFNARDAMPHGGELRIETAITACESAPERARNHRRGDYAVLRVSDNGIGMSEETKSRIFEPFFTTKEIGKGTGLGLAVVFGVVSQSGGHIEVESKSGRGSTFTIYLPLARERAAPPPQPAGVLGAGEGSETVLLVEDEESVRRVLNRVLTSKGYRVLEAAHGREALQQMEQARGAIDLLITDVAMPEMRGPELAERVRARFPHTRVLYISGYAEERTAVESAGDGYLQKPFTPDVLTAKVRQMLDQPRTFALPGAK